jgi:diguanylate cyclase (GGDEF)-like protein
MPTTNVLLLRPDEDGTRWMRPCLTAAGYAVEEAPPGAEVLARAESVHVLVLAISPRHAFVRDLIAAFRDAAPDARVVIACGEGLEGLSEDDLRTLDIEGVMRTADGPLALSMWVRAAARAWRSRSREARRREAWSALLEIAAELPSAGGAEDVLRSVVSRLDRLMGPDLRARFLEQTDPWALASIGNLGLKALPEGDVLPLLEALAAQALEMHRLRDRMAEDDLTGALTRETFYKHATAAIQTVGREGGQFAVAVFDVDRFKGINDGCGHLAGDRILREVTEAVRATLRPEDFVGRFGGDEFLVGLRDTDSETAVAVLERVRRRIRETVAVEGRPVTVSCGVAAVEAEVPLRLDAAGAGEVLGHLLEEADRLLYVSKSRGRDAVSGGGDIALAVAACLGGGVEVELAPGLVRTA